MKAFPSLRGDLTAGGLVLLSFFLLVPTVSTCLFVPLMSFSLSLSLCLPSCKDVTREVGEVSPSPRSLRLLFPV